MKHTFEKYSLGAIVILLFLIWLFPKNVSFFGAIGTQEASFGSGVTNSSSTVNTTSTQILAANSARLYARITNLSANPVYCWLDGATTAPSSSIQVNSGLRMNQTSTASMNFIEFSGNLPYTGAVNCIAAAASAVGIVEK